MQKTVMYAENGYFLALQKMTLSPLQKNNDSLHSRKIMTLRSLANFTLFPLANHENKINIRARTESSQQEISDRKCF
jgi:hypothetical protein